ncbi:DUF2341 domain-containing protein [Fodinibius halophilus]|uniref:DUF2341 domain-containing protein n=1 Tax=Fodinibius halophilus TaxID=1736908 RepID=A0A6M1T1G9_9BACT|nr:DUF2341 domain-containing protein [Fodinibius halophilus]NGP87819.1 DUF2341 domain-containing protein [Fodinibius halophilus]
MQINNSLYQRYWNHLLSGTLLFFFILFLGETVLAQFNNGYNFRKRIQINDSQVSGTQPLSNFPTLVNITNTDLRSAANGGFVENGNGFDIIFTADDGSTQLNHQLESYDATTGEITAWVQVPALAAQNNTYIYVYYGNTSVSTDPSVPTTWDSNYQMVQHFNNSFLDATANNNDGTNNGTTDIAGQILRARDFNGSNNFVEVGDDPSLSITNQITISMWVYGDTFSNTPDLVTKGDYTQSYSTWIRSQETVRFAINNNFFTSNSTINVGTWNYLTFTYDQNQWNIFIDGAQDATGNYTAPINDPNNTPLFISTGPPPNDYPLDGRIDEVRISNTARSADWIATEYNNQNNPGSFLSLVNDPSELSNIENLAKAYNVGSPPINITSTLTVDDYDDATIQSATVQITTNYATNDVLAFSDQNGITGSWNSGSGTLTLSGNATPAEYEAALRSVTFENSSSSPSQSPRTIEFKVNDGTDDSNVQSRQIYIPSINDLSADINNVVFHFSALDVDGDLDTNDQPADNTSITPWSDRSVSAAGSTDLSFSNGTSAEQALFFDNSAAMGERGGLLYDGTDDSYTRSSDSEINIGNFNQKSFAAVFRTGNDISSDQVIYEQGTTNRGYLIGIFNGHLYTYAWNHNGWSAGEQDKSIDLGQVQPYTSYIVIASHDATAGSLSNRTWSANVNGGTIQVLNNTDIQQSHNSAPEIAASNGALDPVNFQSVTGANFDGYIAEFVSWNQSLSNALFSEVFNILDQRWSNEAPQLSNIESSSVSYTEGDPATSLTSTITISDNDNTVLDSARVVISNNFVSSEDVLSFTDANGITGTYNSSTGELFLSGTSSLSNYQAALQSITYENTNNVDPATNSRTISFTVYDWDDPSNTLTRDITITPINSLPSLSNIETTTLTYTEGDGNTPVTSSITVSDTDNSSMQSATIQITANYSQGEDLLDFVDANGITSSWNSSTGTLTLSGSASTADYQTALRNVTYNNLSAVPSTDNRTVTFTVNDGLDPSNSQNRTISITPTNDIPVLNNLESTLLQVKASDPPEQITSAITVEDADDQDIESATIQISNNYLSSEDQLNFTDILGISGSWNSSTGTLTLTGTSSLSNYTTALRSITYDNTASTPSPATRTISFTVNDGDANSSTVSRDIALSAVRSISGLQLWLKGDAGVTLSGSDVTTWEDQSGNTRHFSSAAASNKPQYATNITSLNNQSAIEFDGGGDFLEDADGEAYINGLTEYTLFFVIQSDQTNVNRGFWDTEDPDNRDEVFTIRYDAAGANAGANDLIKAGILGNSPDNQLESFSDIQTTQGQILSYDWKSNEEYNLVVDGVLNNPSAISSPPTGTLSNATKVLVGQGAKDGASQSWDGYIAEVILYDRFLSENERESIEDYLSEKYNISIRLIGKATGGENISADTYSSGTYTSLSGPRLREDFRGELTQGNTIVFEAPSGFEWDTGGSSPSVSIQPAYGNSTNLDISFTSRTAQQITFTVDAESNSPSKPGEALFSGLRIRPTTGTLPNSGTITNSGSTGPGGTTNYGNIIMVPGAPALLNYVQSPTDSPVNQAISPAIAIEVTDQFGNTIEQSGTNISITLSSGAGNLTGTTTQATNANGLVYFNDLKIDQTGTKKLTVNSSGLPNNESSAFDINMPGALASFEIEKVGGGIIPPQTAGTSFDIKISAIDGTGSVDTDFNGSVDISSSGMLSDGGGTTPSFTNGVLSSHAITISNTGDFTITATNSNGSENGTSNSFTVNAGAANKTTSLISASPTYIANDGSSTSTITVQLRDSEGNNLQSGGENVSLSTNAGSLGSVTDNSDGTYTATLTSSTNNETATITGTLNSETITDNEEVTFTQFDAIWEGTLGGDPSAEQWSNGANWNTGTVPQTGDAVLVPADPAVGNLYPVIQSADQTVNVLIIENGADVSVGGGQTLTVNDDLSGGGDINGSNSANLEVGGDLTIQDLQIGNVLLNGTSLQQVENTNQFTNLEIDNSNNVEVNQNIFVDGTLTLTAGNLIIPSGYNLIANDQSVTSGALTFKRALTGVEGWRMISSPVASTYSDLLDGTITQGYSGAFYDADVAPHDTLQPNVLWYDETHQGTDNQRWRAPASASQSLTEARGLFVYIFGDVQNDSRYNEELPDTLEVTGTEFNGNGSEVDFGITYTATADTGWNLVGNPYGATLDWDEKATWTKTNVNQTIYVWDPNANGGNGNFLTWNGQIGSLGSGLIAPFQAFWVKASGTTPSLTVSEQNKTTDGIFRRKEQIQNPLPKLTFKLEAEQLRGIQQKVYMMFDDNAKRGLDKKDGYRMFPFGQNFLELYFKKSNGAQLSIENLPRDFDHRYELAMQVGGITEGKPLDGNLSLSWPTIENIPSEWMLKLKDNLTGKEVNLRKQSFYSFHHQGQNSKQKARIAKNVNTTPDKPIVLLDPLARSNKPISKEKSTGNNSRFTLIITTKEIEAKIPSKFKLKQNYPNPFNPETKIEFGLPEKSRATIEIYDILGRRIVTLARDKTYPAGFHTISWTPNNLASGVYLYRIRTEQRAITKKMTYIK